MHFSFSSDLNLFLLLFGLGKDKKQFLPSCGCKPLIRVTLHSLCLSACLCNEYTKGDLFSLVQFGWPLEIVEGPSLIHSVSYILPLFSVLSVLVFRCLSKLLMKMQPTKVLAVLVLPCAPLA